MKDIVFLVFILEHGSFMRAILPLDRANQIIKNWTTGKVDGEPIDKIAVIDPPPPFISFSVDSKAIKGMHVEPLPPGHNLTSTGASYPYGRISG